MVRVRSKEVKREEERRKGEDDIQRKGEARRKWRWIGKIEKEREERRN